MANEEPSQLLKTAYGLIDAYNSWNMDNILALRAENCTQKLYPVRLNRPPLGNEEYRAYFTPYMKVFENYKIEVFEAVEDPKLHRVAMHMKSTAQTPVGEYDNEYAVFMYMTEDDKQITHVKEYVDSGYSTPFFMKLNAYMKENNIS